MDPNQNPSPPQPPYQSPAPVNPVQQAPVPPPAPAAPPERPPHPMVVLQPGERIVCTIKRHPFGILSLYLAGAVAMIILVLLAVVLLPRILDQYDYSSLTPMIYAGMGIVVVAMVLILAVATIIYWQSEWVVTTDSITQISQNSLFNRQVSQVSMDNLEDVTVDQNGIIPHLFNFGILKVESAGERSKFQFPYCPNPNMYARQILEIHETFLEERRNIRRL